MKFFWLLLFVQAPIEAIQESGSVYEKKPPLTSSSSTYAFFPTSTRSTTMWVPSAFKRTWPQFKMTDPPFLTSTLKQSMTIAPESLGEGLLEFVKFGNFCHVGQQSNGSSSTRCENRCGEFPRFEDIEVGLDCSCDSLCDAFSTCCVNFRNQCPNIHVPGEDFPRLFTKCAAQGFSVVFSCERMGNARRTKRDGKRAKRFQRNLEIGDRERVRENKCSPDPDMMKTLNEVLEFSEELIEDQKTGLVFQNFETFSECATLDMSPAPITRVATLICPRVIPPAFKPKERCLQDGLFYLPHVINATAASVTASLPWCNVSGVSNLVSKNMRKCKDLRILNCVGPAKERFSSRLETVCSAIKTNSLQELFNNHLLFDDDYENINSIPQTRHSNCWVSDTMEYPPPGEKDSDSQRKTLITMTVTNMANLTDLTSMESLNQKDEKRGYIVSIENPFFHTVLHCQRLDIYPSQCQLLHYNHTKVLRTFSASWNSPQGAGLMQSNEDEQTPFLFRATLLQLTDVSPALNGQAYEKVLADNSWTGVRPGASWTEQGLRRQMVDLLISSNLARNVSETWILEAIRDLNVTPRKSYTNQENLMSVAVNTTSNFTGKESRKGGFAVETPRPLIERGINSILNNTAPFNWKRSRGFENRFENNTDGSNSSNEKIPKASNWFGNVRLHIETVLAETARLCPSDKLQMTQICLTAVRRSANESILPMFAGSTECFRLRLVDDKRMSRAVERDNNLACRKDGTKLLYIFTLFPIVIIFGLGLAV
ncbi:hypothetical protein PoB_002454500 [Plakobranchus ocellatus]|uniref:SMB domain-containing protein n=1 Tax=Plakobranchus ocellatus TaxID=259542 RepID=A0AAV3ZSG6_9GAST|nr:hypothetical protein PoB_002454500 [Plakobranchus ocellatus]